MLAAMMVRRRPLLLLLLGLLGMLRRAEDLRRAKMDMSSRGAAGPWRRAGVGRGGY